MAYNVPPHGAEDWDIPLLETLEYLRTLVLAAETPGAAAAKAVAAQNAAAADATNKANVARDAAIAAAAVDASAKANSAQAAAIAAMNALTVTGGIYIWQHDGTSWPTPPGTKPTGVVLVHAIGPTQPGTPPTWMGQSPGQTRVFYFPTTT